MDSEDIHVYPISSAQWLELYDILQGSYTVSGFRKWLERPRPAFLDGKTPIQAIEDGEYEKVKNIAISCRDGAMGT